MLSVTSNHMHEYVIMSCHYLIQVKLVKTKDGCSFIWHPRKLAKTTQASEQPSHSCLWNTKWGLSKADEIMNNHLKAILWRGRELTCPALPSEAAHVPTRRKRPRPPPSAAKEGKRWWRWRWTDEAAALWWTWSSGSGDWRPMFVGVASHASRV